jgi:hypothetical protein
MSREALIQNLKKEFVRERGVVIVAGTDVSIAACGNQKIDGHAVASWTGLLRHGLALCQERDLVNDEAVNIFNVQIESGAPEFLVAAAQGISARLANAGSGVFRGWLQETVGKLEPEFPDILESLAALPCVLATLNYDGLFEKSTNRRNPVTWVRADKVQDILRGDFATSILRLHGHYDEPDSVVLGFDSYNRIASDEHTIAVLRSFLIDRTLLFVGCSGTVKDPNFSRLIKWAKVALEDVPPRHVILHRDRNEDLDAVRADLASAPWLLPLSYGKEYADLPPFLRNLSPPPKADSPHENDRIWNVEINGDQYPPRPLFEAEVNEQFVGRERQLRDLCAMFGGLAANAFDGPRTAPDGEVRLIWVCGYGGMGKSWLLRKAFVEAKNAEITPVLIDWQEQDWHRPLKEAATNGIDVFRPIALRLRQVFGSELLRAFDRAHREVQTSARARTDLGLRFNKALAVIKQYGAEVSRHYDPSINSHVQNFSEQDIYILEEILEEKRLFNPRPEEIRARIERYSTADPIAWHLIRCSWIARVDAFSTAAVSNPEGFLSDAMCDVLHEIASQKSVFLILDTCERISPKAEYWLGQCLARAIGISDRLVVLIGTRGTPAERAVAPGRDWVNPIPSRLYRLIRLDDAARFNRLEIRKVGERVLGHNGLSEQMVDLIEEISRGVPMAVCMLLDMLKWGESLKVTAADDDRHDELDAASKVIACLVERYLLHVYRNGADPADIKHIALLALALRPGQLLDSHWGGRQAANERLMHLARNYSLVDGSDLHETVKKHIRQHWWRSPDNVVLEVATRLAVNVDKLSAGRGAEEPEATRFAIERINLRFWIEGKVTMSAFAPVLGIAIAHEHDLSLLAKLAAEVEPLVSEEALVCRWIANPIMPLFPDVLVDWLDRQTRRDWPECGKAAVDLLVALQQSRDVPFMERGKARDERAESAILRFESALAFYGANPPRRELVIDRYLQAVFFFYDRS